MTAIPLPPGLMLVHGNRPEALRDLLMTWVRRYPLAPLETEVILAQSNGIAQWLKLALAADPVQGEGGLGIAAALEISLPSRFLWRVYRAVLGGEAVPETSPFDKSRLVWRLMRLLPEVMTQPEYQPLARFLTADTDRRKRFQLAERLADLYDQYQVYRADWLVAWATGADVLIDARGNRGPLPAEQRWQASLWRALLADVGRLSYAGRAAVHEAFLARAVAWPAGEQPPGLPRRLLVFGISSLPRQSLEVLAALGRWSQILLCVHNPCEHYWADIVADQDLLRAEHRRQRRRAGMPATFAPEHLHLHAHPLLAAWGKQGRDFIGLLDEHDDEEVRDHYAARFQAIGQRIDLFDPPRDPAEVTTLLAQLQDDIRDLRPLAESRERWPPVDPARDFSLRFHVAHGPQREVEILHDQLLAAFNTDPSLTPRDIIVMVPDIDAYAPHIQAVFGLVDRQDPRFIPFSLADQGRRATDPLLKALEALLALPQSRLAVSDLLDLLEVPALRRRFGIAEDELPRLHRWVRGANIRWGLHAAQRASLELPEQPEAEARHTWRFGLRRMLLGYAVGQDAAAWRGIEPFDEIGGLDAALLGPLTRFFAQLDATWRTLREPASVADWCVQLRQLLADYFDAGDSDSGDDAFTLLQLESALQDWQEAADAAGLTESLPLSIVGEHWLAQLDERGLSQRFFAGAVTFATLMPMRAIPFRLVCLLGMNDGDYPRQRQPLDFDLMGQDYRPGDRSRREDDRYLFLEALLSARERLHISWVGRSITDNGVRPPSVLVGQLRDHLAAGWRLASPSSSADWQASVSAADTDAGLAPSPLTPSDRTPAGLPPAIAESAPVPARGLVVDTTPETIPNALQAPNKKPPSLLDALTQEHPLQPFSPRYFPSDPAASPWFTYAREWRPGTDDIAPAPMSGRAAQVGSNLAEGTMAVIPGAPALSASPGRMAADGGRRESIPGGLATASLRLTPPSAATRPSPLPHNSSRDENAGIASGPDLAGQAPLPPLAREEPFRLRDLADFLKAPVKAFFTQRLGVYFEVEDPAAEDQEPFALDHLQRWLLNDELIQTQARAVAAGEPLAEVRTARLDQIRRRGDLPPGGFGETLALELEEPMDKLFAQYREALARWPQPLAEEMEILFTPTLGAPGAKPEAGPDLPTDLAPPRETAGEAYWLQPPAEAPAEAPTDASVPGIADWLGGLRADAAGHLGRVVLETSDLVKDRHYRGEKMIRHWVAHLAGNLGEAPLTTLVLSKVGKVELPPLPPDQARGHLAELLRALEEGLRHPLPLATRTAFAWLKGGGDAGAARQTYDGGYNQQGEVETNPYLARVYPDFAALTADGTFTRLAETLYGPLLAALPAAANKQTLAGQADA